jgi:MoxR-like ATPase
LIDELDRADDEFDAFLLEMLSDFSVTIPELGTIAAAVPPLVVATSNRTRDLHDALTRRCLYHWIEFPTLEREVDIIRRRAPEVTPRLALSVATTVARIRSLDLDKAPGPAESADWAQALLVMGSDSVADDAYAAEETLGAVVKNYADRRKVREALPHLLHD